MCIQWTSVLYSVEIKLQKNHNSIVCVMESGQCLYTIHNDTLSGEFRCVLGVRQGESLSPLLFSM